MGIVTLVTMQQISKFVLTVCDVIAKCEWQTYSIIDEGLSDYPVVIRQFNRYPTLKYCQLLNDCTDSVINRDSYSDAVVALVSLITGQTKLLGADRSRQR